MKKSLLAALLAGVICLAAVAAGAAEPASGIISVGAEYKLKTPASAAYPDTGKLLTDGARGELGEGQTAYYSTGAYVGFNSSQLGEDGIFEITVDLGRVCSDLTAFSVGYLNETSVGVFAPEYVEFSVCDTESGDYSPLGKVETAKTTAPGDSQTHVSTLATDPVSGRYVKATVKALKSYTGADGAAHNAGWTFIDEISVYSSGAAADPGGSGGDSSGEDASSQPAHESGTSSAEESRASSVESSAPPKTGDASTDLAVWLFFAAVSLVSVFALVRKRAAE